MKKITLASKQGNVEELREQRTLSENPYFAPEAAAAKTGCA